MRPRDTPTGSKRRIAAECGGTGDPGNLQPALELQLETRWGRIFAPANEPLGRGHVPGVPADPKLPPKPGIASPQARYRQGRRRWNFPQSPASPRRASPGARYCARVVADYPLSNRRFPIDRPAEGQKKAVLQENPASCSFEEPVTYRVARCHPGSVLCN
jgi:hypothetical protein